MEDRFNTIAGWTLGAGIVALGLGSISGHYFRAGKESRPEKMGYAIEGVVQEGVVADATPFEAYLAKADLAKGETTFKKCAACHSINQGGANGIDPKTEMFKGSDKTLVDAANNSPLRKRTGRAGFEIPQLDSQFAAI